MFSNPLIETSMIELLLIWGELVEAYHGVNGFGGYTAEIYAYRLLPNSPYAYSESNSNLFAEHTKDRCCKASNALMALIVEFCRQYECKAHIDNMTPEVWLSHIRETFDHRAHITIIV